MREISANKRDVANIVRVSREMGVLSDELINAFTDVIRGKRSYKRLSAAALFSVALSMYWMLEGRLNKEAPSTPVKT